MRPGGNTLKLVSLQYKTQLTEMEQRLNEARRKHAKAVELYRVVQKQLNSSSKSLFKHIRNSK